MFEMLRVVLNASSASISNERFVTFRTSQSGTQALQLKEHGCYCSHDVSCRFEHRVMCHHTLCCLERFVTFRMLRTPNRTFLANVSCVSKEPVQNADLAVEGTRITARDVSNEPVQNSGRHGCSRCHWARLLRLHRVCIRDMSIRRFRDASPIF